MTKTKERTSKGSYRQCVMNSVSETSTPAEYVAWLPSKLVRIGKVVRIDGVPGQWKIVDAGDARPAYIVEAYAEHGRTGLPDGQGPSTPMRTHEHKSKK